MANLDPALTDALNRHGVFFKKKVLLALRTIDNVQVLAEEMGFTFGETRVVDILAQIMVKKRRVVFAIECKKVFSKRKTWVFFKDADTRFRVARELKGETNTSKLLTGNADLPSVCSEGYELDSSDTKLADPNPVFKAGSQIALAFLGLVRRRIKDAKTLEKKPDGERLIPVIITNAELLVAQSSFEDVNIATGNFERDLDVASAQSVFLNHPSPSPETVAEDFRESVEEDSWNHMFKESVWVINSGALGTVFNAEYLDWVFNDY